MDPLLRLASSSSPELMPNAEGDGAGGHMASHHIHIQPTVTSQQACPTAQHSPISLKKKPKSNQIKAHPQDKDGSGSMWAG